jgi:DNA-directed RNA polymerase sigma subunit (sigma70/sigma32)
MNSKGSNLPSAARRDIHNVLAKLTPREAAQLRRRFGISRSGKLEGRHDEPKDVSDDSQLREIARYLVALKKKKL